MARKSLRPQLNQIRAWVRQGRTDAWIAHQLEVSTSQLREFRKRNDLNPEGDDSGGGEVDLRDEIEAEIEAAEAEEPAEEKKTDQEAEDGGGDGGGDRPPRRRRRRRRGGRGRGRRRAGAGMEASIEEDKKKGFILTLDKALKDDPIYSEHWEGHTELKLTVERDRMLLQRAEEKKDGSGDAEGGDSGSGDGDENGDE